MIMLAVAAALMLGTIGLGAHEEFRVIGTITKRQDAQVEMRSREGKLVSMKLDGETLVYRDNRKVDASQLQAGRHVVADVLGDSLEDANLLALELRLIASLPK
jgi:hypothetical protein